DPYIEVALHALPSPDYIPGPEELEQAPPSPDYIPGPEHANDEIIAEDQPYAEDASPIAQSPEYVPESDFEAHPKDDDDEDPEEDPIDYLANGGDNGDDEEESSDDDEDDKDDEMDIEGGEEEEEEEHPAPADSVVVAPTATDQAPSAEETEPFETDESAATPPPHPAYRMTARITIPAPVPMPAWTDSEVVRLLAISSPPASPLSPWSSPPPKIPFPPLPPILSPPSPVEDRPGVTLPPQKRLGITLGPIYEVGESSSATAARPAGGLRADYGFVATVDREIMHDPQRELDEQWFVLTKDTLREALQITPVNNNQAFVPPPSSDALTNFVNELGYLKLVRNLSNVGVVTRTHIDYAERIWEEFTQSIHTFIEDKRNLTRHTSWKKKATLIVIPCIRFTKLIIHHLQRRRRFHPRPDSQLHLPNEEPVLGYLKFSAKGTKREVFGMPIPGKKRTLKSAAESVAEDAPAKEPQVAAEDADMEKALEESIKSMYDMPRGPLPPMVIKEPKSGKYQPLTEVPGKGKAKVSEEQVAHDLLSLQKPKKKSPADQYIFQRRASTPTGSSGHDESLYAMLGQSDSEEESEKVVPGADAGGQGQAGSNPDGNSKGQARPDPGNAGADEQTMPSPVVHDGSDREHMDLDVADVSPQPSTEQMDEWFPATTYLKVQENLKLTVEEQNPIMTKQLQKPETKVESMVSVTIQHDMSLIPPMTSSIIDLTSRPESPKVHQQIKATTTETTTTTLQPPPDQRQSTKEAMMMKRIGELEHIMANLIQENKGLEERLDKHEAYWAMQAPLRNRFRDLSEADMKEILHQRMWETESYKSHEDHMLLYEALKKSINRDYSQKLAQDLAEACKKKKKSRETPKTPSGSPPYQPPPPPPAGPSGASGAPGASGSSQVPPPPPPPSSANQENLEMDEDMAPDEQAQSSDDKDIGSAHIPKVNLRQDWWKPLEERPATPEPAWSILSSDLLVPKNNWASAPASKYSPPPEGSLLAQTGPAFEIVKVFHPDVIHLQYQMEECHKLLTDSVDDSILRYNVSKPLPLGGLPGQMKAAYYPDAGLEQMVPDQFWIEEECKYDIAAMYVKTRMRILSVVRIEVFFSYGYDYMKKIVLRQADLNEHVIAERDFKYLYPSDFEDIYLLHLQGHLNHLPSKDKKILTTVVNQWTRHLDQQDESRFKYEVLDQEGCGSEQGVHVRHSEAVEDKEDLPQSGELCWWTRQIWRLQTLEAYRIITSFWHSRLKCRLSHMCETLSNIDAHIEREQKKHLLLSGIEDSVMDQVAHKFNPLATQELLIESISTNLKLFDDSYATKAFNDSLEEHKQHKSGLENPIDFEEEILDADVQQNKAISLSEEEIALDVASSKGTMSSSGSEEEEGRVTHRVDKYRFEFFDDSYATKAKKWFNNSLEGLHNIYYEKYGKPATESSSGASSSRASGEGNQMIRLLNRLQEYIKKKARKDPSLAFEYERYVNSNFATLLHNSAFATFDLLGFWKVKESMYPVLSRMAMDIISVQDTSVTSESECSASERVLSIRRTHSGIFRDVYVFKGSLGRSRA
nr:squalene synthase [Tanacetum cinerariifolium]